MLLPTGCDITVNFLGLMMLSAVLQLDIVAGMFAGASEAVQKQVLAQTSDTAINTQANTQATSSPGPLPTPSDMPRFLQVNTYSDRIPWVVDDWWVNEFVNESIGGCDERWMPSHRVTDDYFHTFRFSKRGIDYSVVIELRLREGTRLCDIQDCFAWAFFNVTDPTQRGYRMSLRQNQYTVATPWFREARYWFSTGNDPAMDPEVDFMIEKVISFNTSPRLQWTNGDIITATTHLNPPTTSTTVEASPRVRPRWFRGWLERTCVCLRPSTLSDFQDQTGNGSETISGGQQTLEKI